MSDLLDRLSHGLQNKYIAPAVRRTIEEARNTIIKLTQDLEDSHNWEKMQEKRIKELQSIKFVTFSDEEHWVYTLDEDNGLESLVCPVTLSADDMREIEKRLSNSTPSADIQALIDELKKDGFTNCQYGRGSSDRNEEIVWRLNNLINKGDNECCCGETDKSWRLCPMHKGDNNGN